MGLSGDLLGFHVSTASLPRCPVANVVVQEGPEKGKSGWARGAQCGWGADGWLGHGAKRKNPWKTRRFWLGEKKKTTKNPQVFFIFLFANRFFSVFFWIPGIFEPPPFGYLALSVIFEPPPLPF